MAQKGNWESPSLDWLHRLLEEHYESTKDLPLEAWLKWVNPEKAARACCRLGLKVRLAPSHKRQTLPVANRREGTGDRENRRE